jgi:hypothetical protein
LGCFSLDGVAVYLKRGATLVLAAVLGSRVFGEGIKSWEQRAAVINNQRRAMFQSVQLAASAVGAAAQTATSPVSDATNSHIRISTPGTSLSSSASSRSPATQNGRRTLIPESGSQASPLNPRLSSSSKGTSTPRHTAVGTPTSAKSFNIPSRVNTSSKQGFQMAAQPTVSILETSALSSPEASATIAAINTISQSMESMRIGIESMLDNAANSLATPSSTNSLTRRKSTSSMSVTRGGIRPTTTSTESQEQHLVEPFSPELRKRHGTASFESRSSLISLNSSVEELESKIFRTVYDTAGSSVNDTSLSRPSNEGRLSTHDGQSAAPDQRLLSPRTNSNSGEVYSKTAKVQPFEAFSPLRTNAPNNRVTNGTNVCANSTIASKNIGDVVERLARPKRSALNASVDTPASAVTSEISNAKKEAGVIKIKFGPSTSAVATKKAPHSGRATHQTTCVVKQPNSSGQKQTTHMAKPVSGSQYPLKPSAQGTADGECESKAHQRTISGKRLKTAICNPVADPVTNDKYGNGGRVGVSGAGGINIIRGNTTLTPVKPASGESLRVSEVGRVGNVLVNHLPNSPVKTGRPGSASMLPIPNHRTQVACSLSSSLPANTVGLPQKLPSIHSMPSTASPSVTSSNSYGSSNSNSSKSGALYSEKCSYPALFADSTPQQGGNNAAATKISPSKYVFDVSSGLLKSKDAATVSLEEAKSTNGFLVVSPVRINYRQQDPMAVHPFASDGDAVNSNPHNDNSTSLRLFNQRQLQPSEVKDKSSAPASMQTPTQAGMRRPHSSKLEQLLTLSKDSSYAGSLSGKVLQFPKIGTSSNG